MRKYNVSRLALFGAASVIGLAAADVSAQQSPTPTDPQAPPPSSTTDIPRNNEANSVAPRPTTQDEVNAARFGALDADRDGFVSKDEAVKDRMLAQTFAQVDANGDGKISRVEFDKHA